MDDYLKSCADVFGVERRLREIDDGYRVFYNALKSRFEVHNEKNKPNTLVLVSPYAELDSRLIRLVRSSRVERASEIFKEVEEHNEKIIEKQKRENQEKKSYTLDQLQKMKRLLEKGGEV